MGRIGLTSNAAMIGKLLALGAQRCKLKAGGKCKEKILEILRMMCQEAVPNKYIIFAFATHRPQDSPSDQVNYMKFHPAESFAGTACVMLLSPHKPGFKQKPAAWPLKSEDHLLPEILGISKSLQICRV